MVVKEGAECSSYSGSSLFVFKYQRTGNLSGLESKSARQSGAARFGLKKRKCQVQNSVI